MKDKTTTQLASVIFPLGCAFVIVSLVFDFNMFWQFTGFVVAVAGSVLVLAAAQCPHCGRFGLRMHPLSSHAGNCRKCGKPVEWREN